MARGFESKMVEFQQEEAARRGAGSPRAKERSSLELARARAAADLERAKNPAHRKMLESAIAALDEQLGHGARG
jgi:hypothetical protein